MSLIIVLCAIGFILLLLKNNKIKRLKQLTSNIPGPKTYPVIGNGLIITSYKDGILKYLENAQKQYGTVMRHWIGAALYVHISDPRDVEILLRDTKNIKKSSTYSFLKPWLGEGLISSTGAHWHNHRKTITPAFHFNILENFVKVFNEKGKTLIKLLRNHTGKENFNIFPIINLYALDAIMESSMGIPCNTQEQQDMEYVKAIHSLTKIVQIRSYNVLLRSDFLFQFTKMGREQNKFLKIVHGFCEKIITARKAELQEELNDSSHGHVMEDTKREAFLTLLLKGQREGSGFTNKDITDEVNSFIFGGHDTTSAAMAFAVYHLSRNQSVQQKVYDEIIDLYGHSDLDLTLQDLQRTEYLDMVIKEVLRLSPPIPVVSRELESDLQLTNNLLPAGCAVSVLIYMLHRNPEVFPNPDVFDPERFSPQNMEKKNPYAYVPFSAGPRNCIGQRYAQLEIKASLIKLLRNFKFFHGEKVKETTFMVLTASNGIKIRMEERYFLKT